MLVLFVQNCIMTTSPPKRPRKPKPQVIPSFALYGESVTSAQDMLHIEELLSRSQLYQWEIEPHVHHGLYQVLWLQQGTAEVLLDEQRESVLGPVAIVVPPGVVHGFRFAPATDGMVLTLSAKFLEAGEFQAVGEAFRALFAAPGLLPFEPEQVTAVRLNALLRELLAEFLLPGSDGSPVPVWLARALVWRLARACARGQQAQDKRAYGHQALFTR